MGSSTRLGSRHWRGRPASDEQIEAFERGMCGGVTVPDDYRAFLRTYNGGNPIPIAPRAATPGPSFASFFELDADDSDTDLHGACVTYFTRLPPPMAPIGLDADGKLLCLSIMGPNRGRVYARDLVDLKEPPIEIAPSFAALLHVAETDQD
jgi:hypothetical protein